MNFKTGSMLRRLMSVAAVCFIPWCASLRAQETRKDACPRPQAGSTVPEPADLRSHDGVLRVDLTVQQSHGTRRLDALLLHRRQRQRIAYSAAASWRPAHSQSEEQAERSPPRRCRAERRLYERAHAHGHARRCRDKRGPVQQRLDDGDVHQSAFPRLDHSSGLPPRRRAEHVDPAGRCAIRVPVSDPGERAAGIVLVSPAYPRIQQGAGARRSFRRDHYRRNRARESKQWRDCRSAC